ncbi:MAG: hypothetical protein ACP5KG_09995 [Myxococcota bacterium]
MRNIFMVLTSLMLFSNIAIAGVAGNIIQCKCGDEGVTLTVISGCEGWNDATQCTGWASVAHENGKSETDLFPDKTQLTAFNCTIQINCPQSANTSDAGTTITEEKKDEDSGWCSIVSVN